MARTAHTDRSFTLRDLLSILALFLVFVVGRLALERRSGRVDSDLPSATTARTPGSERGGEGDSTDFRWEGWYEPEDDDRGSVRRWSADRTPAVVFVAPEGGADAAVRFDLEVEALSALEIEPRVGLAAGRPLVIPGPGVHHRAMVFPAHALVGGANRLTLELRGTPVAEVGGSRQLLMALRGLVKRDLQRPAERHVNFRDEAYFVSGWSMAEKTYRWTDGERALLALPLRLVDGRTWSLLVTGSSVWEQGIELVVNGRHSCRWSVGGSAHRVLVFELPAGALRDGLNELELVVSSPYSPAGDPRRLGWAFEDLYVLRPQQLPDNPGRDGEVENSGGLWRACSAP